MYGRLRSIIGALLRNASQFQGMVRDDIYISIYLDAWEDKNEVSEDKI